MGISKTIPWRKKGILEGSIQNTGSTGDVSFTVSGNSSEKITVNYGDGTSETKSLSNGSFSHTYPANSGPFRIIISGALFAIENIKAFPGFQLEGLRHTPNLLRITNSFFTKVGIKGSISNFAFTPDIQQIDIARVAELSGDISFLSKTNGNLGKNGGVFRISAFLGNDAGGDVENFQFLHPDITVLRPEFLNLTGDPSQIFSLPNLSNLTDIRIEGNSFTKELGNSNTTVQQTGIKFLSVDFNRGMPINLDLFDNPNLSSIEIIDYRNVGTISGDNSFFSNLTNLTSYTQNSHSVSPSDIGNISQTIEKFRAAQITGDGSAFKNKSFPELRTLESDANAIGLNIDAKHLNFPEIQVLKLTNAGLTGTLRFTNNQPLVKVKISKNNISDIDIANNNYQLGKLERFDISENSIPQNPLSDWWIFNDDANLNAPASGDTYKMDSSGANMGELTSAAQTAANNIASKGWVTSFNS